MAEIYIHIPGGEQLSIVPEASSSQDWALMGDNKLSLSFQRYECSILPAGAWCEFDGVIFYLLQEYKPTMIHSHLWQYNVAFVDGASWLGVTTALKTIDGEDAPLFTLTAPAIEHATIIVSNLNRRLGTTMWKVGSVIDTPNITIEYTGKYCGAVLQEIVDDQNTEWWVGGTTLNIGRAEFGSLIELGYRDGLLGDITVTHADNMSSYRTLYPVGSTRNILPTEYGHDRLQLPNGQKSVMMNPAGVAELVEEAAFAGIYPRYKGKVTGVSTSIGQSNDGSQYLIYIVADTAIPFNPNDYEMPGLVKHITFQSGELMGAEFEVNYNPASNEFELITQFQENGSQLPGGMLIPQVGDEYVVWNISMPAEYYPLAEQELLEAAESFAAASTRESNVYKVKLDYIDVQERGLSLRPGQKVRLHSVDYFPEQGYYDSRITRVTRPVNYPGEYTIDVSAVRVVGSLTRLQASLAAAATKVNSLSNTVQTVVQTVSNAVTLTGNQRVQGVKNFVDGVRIGGLFASKLKDDTLYFDGNIVLRGGLTMYGKNTTTSPSIFSALPIDGETIGRNERGELCVIGGASGGGGGTGGGISIADVEYYLTTNGYATQSWVNGAGYITGITGAMVTNALGYTPYNSSNPAGYITSSGSITGNAATANRFIEEVVADLNNATAGRIFTMTSGYGSTDGNKPTTGWVTGITLQYAQNGAFRRQLAYSDVDLYIREEHNGVWEKWRKILTSTNFYNYALPITGGAVNGNVRINKFLAVGAASSSTNTARAQIHLVSSGANPCDLYFGADDTLYWSVTARNASDAGGFNKAFALYDVTSAAYRMMMFPNGNLAIGGTTASEKLHVYGNIKLTGDLDGGVYFLRSSNAANPLLRLAVGSQYYYVQAMADAIYVGATSATSLKVTPTGDTTVRGNLLATGAITMYYSSDRRLKQDIRKVNASKVLMSLGGVYEYEYIDSEVHKNHIYEGTHFGLIYQNVKGSALDKMCFEREDGYGSLNYLDANFISLIAGATMENISEVEKLKRKVRALENKVKQLENRA